jgi:chemotaxis protein methyltransferase CheR
MTLYPRRILETGVANSEADRDTEASDAKRMGAGTRGEVRWDKQKTGAARMLSNQQFDRSRRLALKVAGIELYDRHREVLARRSQRLGVLDSTGVEGLLERAERGELEATQRFINLLTTKFTGFRRHPRHFEIAAQHAFTAAQRRGRARLWSAAAATGEEAYSLALALLEVFPFSEPPASILATDVDASALEAAQQGEYREAALRGLELECRQRFMAQTSAGTWSMAPFVRKLVSFQVLNLTDDLWPVTGPFDVIFCRNVLMYLGASHRRAVLEHMAAHLAPGGLLILDPAEHLGPAASLYTPLVGGVCSLRQTSSLDFNGTRRSGPALANGGGP